MAGVSGGVVALIADAAFSAFYGWQLRDHLLIATFVTVAGFLVGLFGYMRMTRISQKARKAELTQIDLDEDGRAR